MKRFLIFLAFLLCPLVSRAQQTPITATVLDPKGNPYQFLTGSASIACPGNQAPLYNGFSVPRTYAITGGNGFGTFNLVLYDVNSITPSGCSYNFFITAGNGITTFTAPTIGGQFSATPITGTAVVNLSVPINAYAVLLPSTGGGGGSGPALQTNDVTNPNQTVLNFVPGTGITITSNSAGAETFTATSANVSITNQAAYAISSNVSGTPSVVDSTVCTPPSVNGQYTVGYTITGGAAAAPSCPQVGLAADEVAGSTVLYSDNNNIIYNPNSALALPTPTTLGNANFFTTIINNGSASTITPVTWTISLNGAGAGSTAVVGANTKCSLLIDQVASTQWDLDCVPIATGTTGTGVAVRATSPTLVTPTLGAATATSVNTNGGATNTFGIAATYGQAACETTFGITTLSGASTTTGLTCLPANSIILSVEYRITTTITTATSFTIGDSGSATRYCGTQSTLTSGTTGYCTAAGYYFNSGALGVKVTPSTTPGAGAIRLTVTYLTLTAPTS